MTIRRFISTSIRTASVISLLLLLTAAPASAQTKFCRKTPSRCFVVLPYRSIWWVPVWRCSEIVDSMKERFV